MTDLKTYFLIQESNNITLREYITEASSKNDYKLLFKFFITLYAMISIYKTSRLSSLISDKKKLKENILVFVEALRQKISAANESVLEGEQINEGLWSWLKGIFSKLFGTWESNASGLDSIIKTDIKIPKELMSKSVDEWHDHDLKQVIGSDMYYKLTDDSYDTRQQEQQITQLLKGTVKLWSKYKDDFKEEDSELQKSADEFNEFYKKIMDEFGSKDEQKEFKKWYEKHKKDTEDKDTEDKDTEDKDTEDKDTEDSNSEDNNSEGTEDTNDSDDSENNNSENNNSEDNNSEDTEDSNSEENEPVEVNLELLGKLKNQDDLSKLKNADKRKIIELLDNNNKDLKTCYDAYKSGRIVDNNVGIKKENGKVKLIFKLTNKKGMTFNKEFNPKVDTDAFKNIVMNYIFA